MVYQFLTEPLLWILPNKKPSIQNCVHYGSMQMFQPFNINSNLYFIFIAMAREKGKQIVMAREKGKRKRAVMVRCRLDRVLANEEWHTLFLCSYTEYL